MQRQLEAVEARLSEQTEVCSSQRGQLADSARQELLLQQHIQSLHAKMSTQQVQLQDYKESLSDCKQSF